MYTKITNPITNRKVNINSALGQNIIRKYIQKGSSVCSTLGECGNGSFCVNDKCKKIDPNKTKSGARKKVFLPDRSEEVYSEIKLASRRLKNVRDILKEEITKEYMASIFEFIYDKIPIKYKSYVPFTPKVSSVWFNPIPIINQFDLYEYNYKYSEKNIFKLGYDEVIGVTSIDNIERKFNKLLIKARGKEHELITQKKNSEIRKLFMNNVSSTDDDIYDYKLKLIIANIIMNQVGIIHSDIKSDNVLYNKEIKRICFIDWGIVSINNDSFKELGISNYYSDLVLDDKFLNKRPSQSQIINEIKPLLLDITKDALKKYPKLNFINIGFKSIKAKIKVPSDMDIFLSSNVEEDIIPILSDIKENINIGDYGRAKELEDLLIELNKLYPNLHIFIKSQENCNCLNDCDYRNFCDKVKGFCVNTKKCDVNPLTCNNLEEDYCL
jgi:serine/threonine protein kinase